jgi:protocatechuate 3,4-dioxygenase beta subunit
MKQLTPENITAAVCERFASCADARLRTVMLKVVEHLHDLAREVTLTPDEWMTAIRFLTDTGGKCDEKRQEFILLSDTLGLSALVDLIANRARDPEATESSLLGPFFREGAPELAMGSSIARHIRGREIIVSGQLRSLKHRAVAGATIDVWQASPSGVYDLQTANPEEMDLRGRFRSDGEGRYCFRSVKTRSYPVPTDGPVGTMLNALGRHPYRPAHIHFKIEAAGFRPLTTALYIAGDEYLDSDAVFGARGSLIVDYKTSSMRGEASGGLDSIEHDFVLDYLRSVEPAASH